MVTFTDAAAVAETVKQRFGEGFKKVEEDIERGRRVIAGGRRVADEGVATAVLHVRRHPLRAVALVAAVGAFAGCVIGFALGRRPWKART
jgi:ElaB/YqjD/DUF883 family membrane-anchored ribosome-binding protein